MATCVDPMGNIYIYIYIYICASSQYSWPPPPSKGRVPFVYPPRPWSDSCYGVEMSRFTEGICFKIRGMHVHSGLCTYMYACIYASMHVCMHVCIYMHVSACMCMYMHAYACKCIHMNVYACLCMCMHVTYMFACMHLCILGIY